ncbi:RraA family protein [Eoetvoesiella caeni]|uniref:Putative 4-hydroxy-4-methyl-2-oxoglutarate aldolase n=1 Tax=Eoetvoesiella caeni TaxID=645616 RepID=A0A366H1P7_9BURK|nr:RraA family protein [Eoetvoesiella caeni]MCI2810970.1 RraA family protein [Eoetvoesiella caeni]NYT56869.1 RraA family protein [Eoetvoesiella caeni]RBP35436.1 regulator of RNase E activity RraA [Eoetvoesiella caeni]
MKDANVVRASQLDTATISDALDKHGLVGQCYRIMPRSNTFRMAGRAWTLMYGPAGSPPGTVGDYIDDIDEDTVIVLDNNGRTDATVWGDILTEAASRKGVAGTVINGVNRDVALCIELNYPIYSLGNWMRTGKDRVQVEATQVPVNIGDVRVCPGDLVRGDADGVVVVPRAFEEQVLASAEAIQTAEDEIRHSVRGGLSLRDARAMHGYHNLQTRGHDE